MTDVTCESFDDAVAELATGSIAEPERSRLLAHAAHCPTCQAQLDGLAVTVDQLLLLAPAIEPTVGFEARALARMGARPPARRNRLAPLLIAAAAAVIALVLGIGLGRASTKDDGTVATASVVTTSGTTVGHVSL